MSSVLLLESHPSNLTSVVEHVAVELHGGLNETMVLKFIILADIDRLKIPLAVPVGLDAPTDNLWMHTCFELFVAEDGETGYTEFNFSPSGQWAVYHFDDYRIGMRPDVLEPPVISVEEFDGRLTATIDLGYRFYGDSLNVGLSAIIEETDGAKSYWALAHPPGKPDFHHKDCFALQLKAPSGA